MTPSGAGDKSNMAFAVLSFRLLDRRIQIPAPARPAPPVPELHAPTDFAGNVPHSARKVTSPRPEAMLPQAIPNRLLSA
eukprot:scaffold154146_cov45-Prasinocladus_malaysianus.AAC.1